MMTPTSIGTAAALVCPVTRSTSVGLDLVHRACVASGACRARGLVEALDDSNSLDDGEERREVCHGVRRGTDRHAALRRGIRLTIDDGVRVELIGDGLCCGPNVAIR